MEVEDRKGLLAAVSAKIADINTNIRNMEAHTDDGRHARIDVTVEISDLKHLERVIKSLRGVDGISTSSGPAAPDVRSRERCFPSSDALTRASGRCPGLEHRIFVLRGP
jgi:hypothetical protein